MMGRPTNKSTMPRINFPQNKARSQALSFAATAVQDYKRGKADNGSFDHILDHIPQSLLSRQKFTALLAASKASCRKRLIDFRLLVAATLATTADQKLSYGTENGYDIADFTGHYNALARARGLPEVSAPAIEYQLKKTEFTVLMRLIFEHMTTQKLKMGLESDEVKKALDLISEAVGMPITDLRSTDGCYFCGDSSLAKYFPASRTAHKEGSKGASQIGIQACYSLKHSAFVSIEITGGTAYEPNHVHPEPNTITMGDAAFGIYANFAKFEDYDAFQVAMGRSNMAAKICEAYVDGKKLPKTEIKGKKPKDFLRYDVRHNVELLIEGESKNDFRLMVDSDAVAIKVPRIVKLRAFRIFDPSKGPTWVLTNLPQTVPFRAVLALMRLRWSIERAFLDLKSHNNLRGARTKSRFLAQSMVWASLITALVKLVTIRCAELLYNRSLSLRRCHKLDQYDQEFSGWAVSVITSVFGRALPGISFTFTEVLHRLGRSKHTGVCRPSAKNRRRSLAHHLAVLIFELGGNKSKEILLLPYKPMPKCA